MSDEELKMNLRRLPFVTFLVTLLGCILSGAGTSDTGGGNSFQGQILESYIWHPETTHEFKVYLAPFFKQISLETEFDIIKIIKSKTWYKIPMPLPGKRDNEFGQFYLRNSTDQIAIQSKSLIQLDSNKYSALRSDKERAKLILHEILMLLYSFNYLRPFEVYEMLEHSQLLNKSLGDEWSRPLSQSVVSYWSNEIRNARSPNPLNFTNEDYENIRNMTEWLFSHRTTLNLEALWQRFKANNFFISLKDLNPNQDSQVELNLAEKITLSAPDLELSLDSLRLSGKLNETLCSGLTFQNPVPCAIEWKIKKISHDYYSVEFSVRLPVGSTNQNFVSSGRFYLYSSELILIHTMNSSFYLYSSQGRAVGQHIFINPNKGELFHLVNMVISAHSKKIIGLSFRPLVFIGNTGNFPNETPHFTQLLNSRNQINIYWGDSLDISNYLKMLNTIELPL
jgi:hypothetical protein